MPEGNAMITRRHLLVVLAATTGGWVTACGPAAPTTPTAAPTTSAPAPTTAPAAKPAAAPTTAPTVAAAAATTGGGELFYALSNKFDTLDPNVTTFSDVGRMAYHLFDPLVWETKAGEFGPGLAESWEVNASADQYTFH